MFLSNKTFGTRFFLRTKLLRKSGSDSKQGQLANDATSSVYDHSLRCILSVACLVNHLSAFLIGWSKESTDEGTDGPMHRRTDPLIEMQACMYYYYLIMNLNTVTNL